jgi:hypothetical protein
MDRRSWGEIRVCLNLGEEMERRLFRRLRLMLGWIVRYGELGGLAEEGGWVAEEG